MKKNRLIIATRESPLALWQANWVKIQLEALHPTLSIELLGLTTTADKLLSVPLYKTGGKGLFVKELEEALLAKKADIAVHSMKDVPMDLPPDLCIPVMCEREDPRDAFVSNEYTSLTDLPENAVVGTSSLRRQSQILAARSDLQSSFLRGNVNTRLEKLDQKNYHAIILAAAGLKRLGLGSRIRSFLPIDEMLPAAGQGVLGIECRTNDEEILALISPLNNLQSIQCVTAERAVCRYLQGGCHVPIAAYAEKIDNQLRLQALVATAKGDRIIRSNAADNPAQAETLGIRVAKDLLRQGAQSLLDTLA
ncbi:MAG TPA: hydroxymethylbilane synthase [Gammaproteobacteria bacterium]|nr:hydroxymethylbilane synthase [Gammaproteobacteria bacterium]